MANASFLPEDYLEKRIQRRTNIISLLLFAVVMAGVVGAYAVTDRQRVEVGVLQKQVNNRFEEAAKRLEQLDQLQHKKEQMIQKARVTAVLLERVPRTMILSELINNMPSTISLLELGLDSHVVQTPMRAANAMDKARQEKKARKAEEKSGQPEPEIKECEVTLAVQGVAPTDVQVAQYMTALGRSLLFTDLNLAYSEEVSIDDQVMRRFRIEMKINQDVDLQKVEPTMVRREIKANPMGDSVQVDSHGKLVVPTASPSKSPKIRPAMGD